MSTTALRPEHGHPRPLADLLRVLPEATVVGAEGGPPTLPLLSGVTHDSRAVRPGDLYLARRGERAHGAAFASAAVAAGARAVLTDEDGAARAADCGAPVVVVPDPAALAGRVAAWVYGEPARDLLLLGVTGTNGKTTTAYLMEAGLRAAGHTTGLVGTVETRIAGTGVPSVRTTPEATDLQALFAVMRERGVTAAAMEVSSHALALHRVDGARYVASGFTNLSQDHLDFHRDLEDYFAAKARLFTPALSARGVVVVDGPYGARLATEAAVPVTTLSTRGDADWRVTDVDCTPSGSAFRLAGPGVDLAARVQLPGAFNVTNAALAIALLATAGVTAEAAVEGVAGLAGVPGRMERVEAGQPFTALVDYAHTPDAVATLLGALRPVTSGRLILVIGCGGDRDRAKRPIMGEAAARGADVVVLTSDNPRSEEPLAILDAVAEGARAVPQGERAEIHVEPDRRVAVATAVGLATQGDTVVVAGKGHEQGQELAGSVVVPFDDRLVLAEAIRAEGACA